MYFEHRNTIPSLKNLYFHLYETFFAALLKAMLKKDDGRRDGR